MSQAVAVAEPSEHRSLTPIELLDRAIALNATPDTLEKLIALQERHDQNVARKAFDEAMAAAKAKIPVILKNREVDFTSTKGRTNYRHEDLAGIARQIDPVLAEFGLSYRYRTSSAPNEPVSVTIILSHRLGHSEETTLSAGRDETGNKNSIQAIGSTVTYLQRYTLKAALGLAASADDDANTTDPVSAEQADELRKLVFDTKANLNNFLKLIGAPSIADISAKRFPDAKALLEAKKTEKANA